MKCEKALSSSGVIFDFLNKNREEKTEFTLNRHLLYVSAYGHALIKYDMLFHRL